MSGREGHDARERWLFDGAGEPDEAEREVVESLRGARWKGDVEGLMRGVAALAGEPPVGPERASRASAPGRAFSAARQRLRGGRRGGWLAGGLALAAAALIGVNLWVFWGRSGAAWERAAGGVWSVGQWVRTEAAEHVEVASDIGRVTIGPDSRVRLVRAGRDEHRLELASGSIDAMIFAPPKLFFVDTPGATAVDMGCAYRMEVAEDGSGVLRVTGGWVELQAEPAASRVPAGAACRIFAGGGLGLPRFEDASEEFRRAVARVEEGEFGALGGLLALARARDGLTLWHLLARVEGPDRDRVFARLAALVPPPRGVSDASGLGSAALEDWWRSVRRAW
ncbi:MAG TPA: hypothetical protein VFF69_08255 [Phycisphaerales bacterium]|nr:hypothetical protein [Phycisphaerales bacterium]